MEPEKYIFADAMGFPIRQKLQLRESSEAVVSPHIRLDLCHATMSPPHTDTMPRELDLNSFASVINKISWYQKFLTNQSAAGVHFIKTREELFGSHRLKVVGGLQYPPSDLNKAMVFILRKMGIVFMTLAYLKESAFGGGFASWGVADTLTDRGKELLDWMNDAGMVLDLSHAGANTAREALDYIDANRLGLPVAATHVGCREVYAHPRNLPLSILRRISERGGIVGLYTLTFTLDPKDDSFKPFFRHLLCLIENLDHRSIAIGGDGVYTTTFEEARADAKVLDKVLDPTAFRSRFPDQPAPLYAPQRMEVLRGEMARNEFLANCGEGLTRKILGENFYDFLTRVM